MFHVGLQENPSEEDAAVVDKIMSSRIVKTEVGILFSFPAFYWFSWI